MTDVRKSYSAQEKAKIVLEILKGELTQQQITAKYGVHSTQLHNNTGIFICACYFLFCIMGISFFKFRIWKRQKRGGIF